MQYYILDTPAGSKETGNVYPQVAFNNVKEAFKFRHNIYPDDEPVLSATLEKGAKLTDILSQASIAGHGLLINDKVKNILADFKIMNHRFYNCPVKDHNGNIHQYYWMALVQPEIMDWIDFKNSSFYLKKGLKNLGSITLNSYNNYLSLKNEMDSSTIVKLDKLIINGRDYDLFKLPLFDNNLYISEKLINSLINVIGILTKEALI